MANTAKWLSVLALVGTIGASAACVSGGGYVYRGGVYGGYGRNDGYARDVERIAHQNGYHEGRGAGEKDARRGRSFSSTVTMTGVMPIKVIVESLAIRSSTGTSSAKDSGRDIQTATTCTPVCTGDSRSLLVPERDHRVEFRGAPRGPERRHDRDNDQQDGNGAERRRIR